MSEDAGTYISDASNRAAIRAGVSVGAITEEEAERMLNQPETRASLLERYKEAQVRYAHAVADMRAIQLDMAELERWMEEAKP